MKIASIDVAGEQTLGIRADDDSVVDLRDLDIHFPLDLRDLLDLGPEVLTDVARRACSVTKRVSPESMRFLPLITRPHAVWCAALNYGTHIEEGNWQPTVSSTAISARCRKSVRS